MKSRMMLGLAVALVLGLSLFGTALAHAKLLSSDPAAGTKLSSAPSKVTLVFSEEISEKSDESFFTVKSASGATVGQGQLDTNDLDHKTLSGTLSASLADGVYTVAWEAVTPDDNGHSEGSFTFGVNVEPGAQPTAVPDHDEDEDAATPTAAAQPTGTAVATPTAAAAASTPTATPVAALPRTGGDAGGMSGYVLLALALLVVGALAAATARTQLRR